MMTKQFQAADPHELRQRLSRQASLSCDTSSTTINLPNITFPNLSSSFPKNADVMARNADVMTKLDDVIKSQLVTTSTPMGTGPPSMTEDEVDKDFWNLVIFFYVSLFSLLTVIIWSLDVKIPQLTEYRVQYINGPTFASKVNECFFSFVYFTLDIIQKYPVYNQLQIHGNRLTF